jgi:antitoxin component of MazEF toxin-antitoxin module
MVTVLPRDGVLPIPPELWKALGWGEHVTVELQAEPHGMLVVRPRKPFAVAETAGLLPKPKRPVSLQEMDEAVASGSEE